MIMKTDIFRNVLLDHGDLVSCITRSFVPFHNDFEQS